MKIRLLSVYSRGKPFRFGGTDETDAKGLAISGKIGYTDIIKFCRRCDVKRIVILALALLLLTGCGGDHGNPELTEYVAPEIVLEGKTVRWEPIGGAIGYRVNVGDKTAEVTGCSYQLDENTPEGTVSVQALVPYEGKTAVTPRSNEVNYTMKDKDLRLSTEYDAGETKLASPRLFLDGDMAAWDVVPFATGYRVYYNGAARTEVTENYCRLTPDEAGEFEITVRAFSSDPRYAASDLSEKRIGTVPVLPQNVTLHVTDAAFGAKGDGKTNDRAAIQKAIDAAAEAGGGTVVLDGGRTYLTGNLFLRDHVTLRIEKNAVLRQSADGGDFVEMSADGEIRPFEPHYGTNLNEDFEFNHCWFSNYPLVGCVRGARDVGVIGEGTVRMMDYADESSVIRAIAVGFGDAKYFKMRGFTVCDYDAYAVAALSCGYGLFEGLTIRDFQGGCTDGVCALNSSHLRVTGCYIRSGDDSIDIGKCSDPRGGVWCTRLIDDLEPAVNIEVDRNDTAPVSDAMKGLSFFLWGGGTENRAAAEVSDVVIHDNTFSTVGIWGPATHDALYGGYGTIPAKNIRWYDNEIGLVQGGFYNDGISDMNFFASMKKIVNGDFEYAGPGFWGTAGDARILTEGGNTFASLGAGGSAWEGLWLEKGQEYVLSLSLDADENGAFFFAEDIDTGKTVWSQAVTGQGFKTAEASFTPEREGNYRIGVRCAQGTMRFDNFGMRSAFDEGCYLNTSVMSVYSVPQGGSSWLFDVNVMPDASLDLAEGDLLQFAYYLDVTECSDPKGTFTFSPLIQRQPLGWATVGEGSIRVKYSDLDTTEGKLLLIFRLRLPKGYDPSTDAISPRLLAESGITFTWEKLIVANEEKDLAAFGDHELVCEKDISSGALRVS